MSTWICRPVILGLVLGLLAGCQEGGGFLGTSSRPSFVNPRQDQALPGAELAGGALALVPPRGFCVDKASLEARFAIIARCDSLGARSPVPDAPLGMIVVSVVAPTESPQGLAETLALLAPPDAEPLESRQADGLALMRLRGATPDGADPRHWRGLARIGPHLMGLAAFGPTGGELTGDAGGRVLEFLVQRSREATVQRPATVAAATPARKGLGAWLRGLSD